MSWSENVRSCEPYVAGEQPKDPQMIKLNTNENPYPPSPLVEKAVHDLKADEMRLYPDPTVGALVHALAVRYRVKDSQVFVGVGSDDVLAMIFMTFFNGDKPILFPDISYSFYKVWAEMLKIPYEMVPLDESFRIRPEDYTKPNGGVIFPNPNAPTGQALPISEVEEIVKANADSLVVVDEAYVDFGTESAVSLINRYDNLIVVQTFSKSRSLAGMRLGYAMASEEIISCLNTIKYSFNSYTINRAAISAGCATVADDRYFLTCCQKIMKTRKTAEDRFRELGFKFETSKANFIFVTHPEVPAKEIFTKLRERHIYVRYFDKPRIDNYLRITIGTDEEMVVLFRALRDILKK